MTFKNNFEAWNIVIHHSGITWWWSLTGINNSHKKRFFDSQKHPQEQWKIDWKMTEYSHIAYHFLIDKWKIYRNRDISQAWYHAWVWDVNINSIAVSINGNFDTEEVKKEDWSALLTVMREINLECNINDIKWHKDVKNTACPWKNLYMRIEDLKKMFLFKNLKMWKYEKIYKEEFWDASVYTNVEWAISETKIDRETFFMLQIWIMRAKWGSK